MGRTRRRMGTVARGRIRFAMTGGAGKACGSFPFGSPQDPHGVLQSGVELQRRVPRDMAVLTAWVLEYLLYGAEGGDSLVALLVGRAQGPG